QVVRKRIISSAYGHSRSDLAFSEPTWRQYAHLHGWEIRIHHDEPPSDQPTERERRQQRKLHKLALLKEHLAQTDLLLWLDADTMFLRYEQDIAGSLYAEDFQGLILEQH